MNKLIEDCKLCLANCKENNSYLNFEGFVMYRIKGDRQEKLDKIDAVISVIKDNPYVQFTNSMILNLKSKL